MPTLYRRARLPRQESEPMVYPGEACTEIGADEPRNAKPLPYYLAEFCRGFWRGMSDGARRFVFWLLLAILLVAAAWHVAARLAALT